MNRKKSIVSLIVVLSLCLTIFSIPGFAASTKRTTQLNLTNEHGNPIADTDESTTEGWQWTEQTRTLTLNGFDCEISSDDYYDAIVLPSNSTIILQGINKVKACEILSTNSDLMICGTGSLDAQCNYGIEVYEGNLTIKDCTLNIVSEEEGIDSCCGDLNIDNSNITALSTDEEGIAVYDGNANISNSTIIAESDDEEGVDCSWGDLNIANSIITAKSTEEEGIRSNWGNLAITNSTVLAEGTEYIGIAAWSGNITIKDSCVKAKGYHSGIQASGDWDYETEKFIGGYIAIENSDIDATSEPGNFAIISEFYKWDGVIEVMPKTSTILLNGNMVVLEGGSICSPFGVFGMPIATFAQAKGASSDKDIDDSDASLKMSATLDAPSKDFAITAAYTFTPDGKEFTVNTDEEKIDNVSSTVKIRTLHTIEFDTNGGSDVAPIIGLMIDEKINLPANPTKQGSTFAGWYLDKELTQKLPENATYKRDMSILYAAWTVTVIPAPVAKTNLPTPIAKIPNTGDSNSIIGMSFLGITSICSAVFISKKKKSNID